MTMNDEVAVSDDWPATFAQVPDWITLHPELPAQSVRAYAFLAMHAPTDGRRRIAFPGQSSIARALKLSRGDKAIPYLRALEQAGAIAVEEIKTPKGRANRYLLRFNPPSGYTGPTCLRDFYGEKDDNQGPWAGWSAATAPTKPDQTGSPQKEGYPRKEGDGSPRKEGTKKTNKNQTKEEAPSARSAGGVRSTSSTGSSARDAGGFAAADEQTPAAKDVPQQRAGGRNLTREEAQAVRAVEAHLPRALLALLPYGRIPGRNRPAVLAALESRTVDQLAERIARRWIAYGYDLAVEDGTLRSAVGAAVELVAPTPHCADLGCEDGVMVDTGEDCRACDERKVARRAARLAGRPVPSGPGRRAAAGPECVDCGRPFPGAVPADGVCRACVAEADRACADLAARLTGEDEARARAEREALEAEAQRRRADRPRPDAPPPAAPPSAEEAAELARIRAQIEREAPYLLAYSQSSPQSPHAPF